ncbi:hypothetical protein [Chachezhania antarctica]|uniref:hypothetical protein n=1 Tax=Chachezhania antarctica TaxID=2340860 RepID=UPI0013CEE2BF|nr:hypothetical protein [Chachezhania antarctica]
MLIPLTLPAAPAFATDGSAAKATGGHPIIIDCYRGPWRQTIWDKPQGTFINDLVLNGYDFANATALATDICRDERLVGDPEGLKAALLESMKEVPPTRKK